MSNPAFRNRSAGKRGKRKSVDLDEAHAKTSIARPRDGSAPLPWFGLRVGSVPELPAKPPGVRR